MGIGSIGAMGSGLTAYGVQMPYLYNTNRLNAGSMNPVKAIGSDVVRSPKTDYSGLAGFAGTEVRNENPLRPYETSDFEAAVERQMALGRQNAARLFG